jgi:two-component system response regulator YesN
VEVVLAVRQAIERLADHVRTSAESTHRAVTAARQLIDTRYAEDLSLERISENVHVSPFHLARIFKTATGTTVMDYVTLVRMDKAKDLMRNPRLSLKEISSLVGYRDQNYFSRVFRRLNGTTPTSFRRAWQ